MAKLRFDHVWKRYPDGTEAVKNLTLDVDDGEFMILVGPSGCGKSTALRMVAGLEGITEGKILIGDRVVNDLTPKERDIAMVFQSYALYPHMTVAANMGFALKLAKVPKDEIAKRVNEAAGLLGLTEYLDRKPKVLSGGQRQRVAMGRAIVREPKAFLMDEPLSNLDAKLRVAMRAEIAQLQDRLQVTTLYVTHDQVEAMTMGDRVAVLKRGELQQVDSPQRLYDNPINLFVGGFIGSPAMNLAEATIERDGDGGNPRVKIGSTTLEIPDAALDRYRRAKDYVGKKIAVGLRPEHFFRPDGSVPDEARMRASIQLTEALGSELLVHFEVEAPPVVTEDTREVLEDTEAFAEPERATQANRQQFTARFAPGKPPKTGEMIDVAFRTDYLHFFDLETGEALR
jgi:multiple sugar transport system ATP-binding protein